MELEKFTVIIVYDFQCPIRVNGHDGLSFRVRVWIGVRVTVRVGLLIRLRVRVEMSQIYQYRKFGRVYDNNLLT